MDYSKGKIYKIVDLTNDDIYIGSTTQTLDRRWGSHDIFRDYDKKKENCEIILIEDYPCESKRQLQKREQYHMDNTECINKYRASGEDMENRKRYQKEYRDNHSSKSSEYKKELRVYQNTWGGDKRNNNNLLRIDPYLFL